MTTTLAAPCGEDDELLLLASAAGILIPGINGTSPTYFFVDAEWMQLEIGFVEGNPLVPVVRGFNGTVALPHLAGAVVQILTQVTQ
jgi:hypothetical protein